METSYLIDLYKNRKLNNISQFLDVMKNMDMSKVIDSYKLLRDHGAPQRQNSYFVDSHNGIPSSDSLSTRREEHLALALFNESRANQLFKLPDGRVLEFIDYQTPLKAKQSDKGIGKIDLFGVIDDSLPAIIELKITSKNDSLADTPLRALLEGLAYCAIIEKNLPKISEEAFRKFNKEFNKQLTLVVLAPVEYWTRYLKNKSTGDWLPELKKVSDKLMEELNIDIILLAMTDPKFDMGHNGQPTKLTNNCDLVSVEKLALSLKH